jgi:hypothetical protein
MSGVLMVASLDGGLRLFKLASYRPSTPVLSRQPQEVPAEMPTWIRNAVAAAKRLSDEEVRHYVGAARQAAAGINHVHDAAAMATYVGCMVGAVVSPLPGG